MKAQPLLSQIKGDQGLKNRPESSNPISVGLQTLPFLPRPSPSGVALSEAAVLPAPGQPCGYLEGGAVVSPFLDSLCSRHLTTAQMFGFQSPHCPDCSPHNASRLVPHPLASVTPRADSEVCRHLTAPLELAALSLELWASSQPRRCPAPLPSRL